MIMGIHHTAIATPDIDRLAAFYCEQLGFEKIYESKWRDKPQTDALVALKNSSARLMMLRIGEQCIELFNFTSPPTGESNPDRPVSDAGFTHIALQVGDIDSEYERLKAAGMRFHAPPTSSPVLRAAYGRDPDGNVVELVELLGPHAINVKPADKFAKEAAASHVDR